MDLAAFRCKTLGALLLALAATGCVAPIPTAPPVILDDETGEPLVGLISFCYGTEANSREEIKAAARESCEGDLRLIEQRIFLNDCPLLQNTRVTYQCKPIDGAGAAGQSAKPLP